MKIRISYPGQDIQVVEAPHGIVNHYSRFHYDPPFVRRILTPATLWHRWIQDKKGKWFWDFNHLEDGHCPNDVPTPRHPSHNQVWRGCKWEKTFVHLDVDNVIRVQSIP